MPGDALREAALRLLEGGCTPERAAAESGHRSATAFARAFQRRYFATPEAFAGLRATGRYAFAYGGPFHRENALAYLARDPGNAAERVEGEVYRRHFPLGPRAVPVTMRLAATRCEVALEAVPPPAEALALHELLLGVLGLEQPLAAFYRHVRGHAAMAALVRQFRGVRMMRSPSLWEALCWAVLGQQINLSFAYRLRNRLIRLGNGLPAEALTDEPLPFPTPEQVLRLAPETLRAHQFSRQKSAYLKHVASAVIAGPLTGLSLTDGDAAAAEEALLSVKGIGRWSAAYGLMRGLGYLDAVPVGDVGLRIALERLFGLAAPPDAAQQEALMAPFRPYRSLATYYLWRSLRATPTE